MPVPPQLKTQHIGKSLDCEFRSAIGAAIRRGDEAKHGRAEHKAAAAIRPHRRDHPRGKVMPAEHSSLELGAEHIRLQILDGSRLAIGAVVEEGGELAVRCLERLLGGLGDGLRLGIVEIKALDADLVAEPGNVLRFPCCGEYAPAARLHLARRSKPDA